MPRPVEVESPQNPLVREIRRLAEREERQARGLCVIEGEHLIREAVAAGLTIDTLCVRPGYAGTLPPARRTVRVGSRALAAMATTEAPQDILAVVALPAPQSATAGLAIAVDGLQDPGNLGTLMRAALAFGAGCIAIGPGSVDPWNPKALRASAGATFRLPPIVVADLAAWLSLRAGAPWVLVPRGGTLLGDADLRGPVTLVVGSEARGVSPQIARLGRPLTIPMTGPVESLNAGVALAVAAYEVARRQSDSNSRLP